MVEITIRAEKMDKAVFDLLNEIKAIVEHSDAYHEDGRRKGLYGLRSADYDYDKELEKIGEKLMEANSSKDGKIKRKKHKKHRWTREEDSFIVEAVRRGYSVQWLADHMKSNVSEKAIKKRLYLHGFLNPRGSGEWIKL